VRKSRYDLDESELKPYFPLESMCAAIFDCAHNLFGLKFVPRPDIVTYHPDVKTYEVKETVDGVERTVGVFLHGEYSSRNKRL
jgi:peptidyl-dipeptidase Dcp